MRALVVVVLAGVWGILWRMVRMMFTMRTMSVDLSGCMGL